MRVNGRVLGLVAATVLVATGCPVEGDDTATATVSPGVEADPSAVAEQDGVDADDGVDESGADDDPEDEEQADDSPDDAPEDVDDEEVDCVIEDCPECDPGTACDPEAEPMDWGSLPELDQIDFEVQFTPSDACPSPPAGANQLTFFFFPSRRGLAASMGGFVDGTGFMGDGVFEFDPRPLRISRNDVPSTEWDDVQIEITPDGATGTWRHIEAEGDLEELDPTLGTETGCGDFDATGPDAGVLFDTIENAPPLDLDAGQVTDWSCDNQGGDLVIGGAAPGLPEGSTLEIIVEISGTDYRQLDPVETITGPDGLFTVTIPGEGVPGDVAPRANHGVYSLGAQFLGPDACGG